MSGKGGSEFAERAPIDDRDDGNADVASPEAVRGRLALERTPERGEIGLMVASAEPLRLAGDE